MWMAASPPRGKTMSKPIPEYSVDIFSRESIRNANAVDDRLREFAPAVRLPGEDIVMLARYEHVAAGLKDWKTFSSTSRPWHDPKSVRPELLLTDDPPKHTKVRAVISNALSPKALGHMAENFRRDARALVDSLKAREGQSVDAVANITQAFIHKVLPDLLGLPVKGREHQMREALFRTDGHHGFGFRVEADIVAPLIPVADGLAQSRNALGDRITVRVLAQRRFDQLVGNVLRRWAVRVAHAHVDNVFTAPAGSHFQFRGNAENVGWQTLDAGKLSHDPGSTSGQRSWRNIDRRAAQRGHQARSASERGRQKSYNPTLTSCAPQFS